VRVLIALLLLASAPLAARPVRIVAVGDTGKGNEASRRVRAAVQKACAARGGCDAGLLLGDNVYERGVGHESSPLLDERIGQLYGQVGFPMYGVVGNHDYGAPDAFAYLYFLGLDHHRATAQMRYFQREGDDLHMPGFDYRVQLRGVELVGFDTMPVYWMDWPPVAGFLGLDKRAKKLSYTMGKWTFNSDARWRIAFGHHPYRSAGHHKDAGNYEGIPAGVVGSGAYFKSFLEENVLGSFDVYIAGHTHNLSDHGDVKGTAVLVSGSGSKLSPLKHEPEGTLYREASHGFVILEVERDTLKIDFITVTAAPARAEWKVSHSRVMRR
jgi:predicted phosphodiesterase